MTDFLELLKNNPYPGRGIAVGRDRVYHTEFQLLLFQKLKYSS